MKHWTALLAVWLLLGATAAYLVRVQGSQRLGTPGVKVVAEPTRDPDGTIVRTNSVYLPERLGRYSSMVEPVTPQESSWLPSDTLFGRRRYVDTNGWWALVSIVLMGADRTSIHKPQYCLEGQGWAIERSEVVSIPMLHPHPYELKLMKITTTKPGKDEQGVPRMYRGIYAYWFVSQDQLTPFHGERMWWMARDLIREGVLQRWAYITYFAVCLPGQEEATFERMKEFIALSAPEFQLASGAPSAPLSTGAAQGPQAQFLGAPGSLRQLATLPNTGAGKMPALPRGFENH